MIAVLLAGACGKSKDAAPSPTGSAGSAEPGGSAAPAAGQAAPFWSWFTEHAAALRADKDLRKTMDTISAELGKASPGVFAEIGADGDNRTLVLSVDGKKDLFPAVQALYAARPTVAGWTIVAFRQRSKAGDTFELGGHKISSDQIKFVAAASAKPAGAKLDLTVFIPSFTTNDEMGQLGFIMLDHAIGEYDMETRIGAIEFAPLSKAPATAKPLGELPALVDALK